MCWQSGDAGDEHADANEVCKMSDDFMNEFVGIVMMVKRVGCWVREQRRLVAECKAASKQATQRHVRRFTSSSVKAARLTHIKTAGST